MFSLALLTVAMTVCRHKSKLLYMFGCERCIGELISCAFTEVESSWPETDFPRRRVLQYGFENQTINSPRAGGNHFTVFAFQRILDLKFIFKILWYAIR